MTALAARVGGCEVTVAEVDARETRLRTSGSAVLPAPGTREGRQLRRWLTQLIITERVILAEAARLGITVAGAPELDEVLLDPAARHELGSIVASTLAEPTARALYAHVTADVVVTEVEIADYHARNPLRFADSAVRPDGWQVRAAPPSLARVRPAIAAHLLAAARRTAFRGWLDTRRAQLVELLPGYEHPGDPRQPDNVHRH